MESPLYIFLAALFCVASFIALRLAPIWPNRHRGCDAYYFLSCVKALKRKFRVPVVLPDQYLAELSEQWYPPAFAVFLSIFPERVLQRVHWLLNHLLDGIVAAIIFWLVATVATPGLGFVFALLYAIQTAVISEYAALTSRPLGAICQLAVLLFGFEYVDSGSFIFLVAATATMALLIFTHKLSLQLMWFLLPFLSVALLEPAWVSILIGGYVLAFVLWPRMFIKIQRAHLDIVRFWASNRKLLGAHPVRHSPVYGDPDAPGPYYTQPSVSKPMGFLKTVCQINLSVVFLPLFLVFQDRLPTEAGWFFAWSLGIYSVVFLTHFLPVLRCVGLAQQYVKFAYVPTFTLGAILLAETQSPLVWTVFLAVLALSIRSYWLTTRAMRAVASTEHTRHADGLIEYIEHTAPKRIMILPYHFADEIVFRTNAAVLWGTHAYSFKMVQSFFPVLQKPIAEIMADFEITHLMIDDEYVRPEELALTEAAPIERKDSFLIYQASDFTTAQNTVEA